MDINNIPIKQDVNPVVDSRTQVSAEEFNCIVETVKANNANRASTPERMGYVILDPDKAFAEQVTQENTIYEIRDEFNLGRIDYTATLDGKYDHYVNGELKGRYYITNSYITVRVGQIIRLPEGFVLFDSSKTNILENTYSPSSNASVYIATLQGEMNALGAACYYSIDPIFEVPAGCALKFEGGSLINGTIKGNNTCIKALKTQIFDLSVGITGSFDTTTAYCEWFGGKAGEASQDKYIQKAIDSFGRVDLLKGKYYIDNPIILTSYQIIQGCGQDLNGTELHKTTKNKAYNIDVTKTGVDLNQDAVILVVPSKTDPSGAGQYNQVQINDISLYGDLNNDYGIYASDGRYAYYNNIYIYGCKNGIRVEYSWMQLFTNVRMNTTYNTVNPFNDSIGFRINELSPYSGYTTINFRNCYAQFFHIGYKLHNCTYGAFDNCACDKCIDTAYYFSNNHAISINANGNEHTLLSDKEHSAAYYFSETEATMNACYSTMDGRAENVENKYLYRIINNSRVVMNNCMHTNDAGIKIKADAYSLLTMIGERTILDDDSVFDVNSENSAVVHYYNGNIRRRGSANADVDVSTIITDRNFREKIPEATTYNTGLMPAYILPSEDAPYGITDANDLQSGSYYVSGNLDNLPDERWGIITTVRTPTSKAGYQIFLCFTGNGAYVRNYGTSWSSWIQITVRSDNYLNRPSDNLYAGHQYFCSDFHKPIWWDGTEWVESDSQPAGIKRVGTWAQRPNADGSFLENGFQYFLLESEPDEDPEGNPMESITGNGKPIWWIQESRKWVDATGATVAG